MPKLIVGAGTFAASEGVVLGTVRASVRRVAKKAASYASSTQIVKGAVGAVIVAVVPSAVVAVVVAINLGAAREKASTLVPKETAAPAMLTITVEAVSVLMLSVSAVNLFAAVPDWAMSAHILSLSV